MKFKVISFLSLFILFSISSAFCGIPERANAENDERERIGEWIVFFDTTFYECWDDADASYYGLLTYADGEIASPVKVYYLSGNLYFESAAIDTDPLEVADGEVTFYWENGNIQSKTSYVAGIKNGPCQIMNDKGVIWQKGQYENGLCTGDWEEYYDDDTRGLGRLLYEDTRTGLWVYTYCDGRKQAQGWWSDGKRGTDWVFYSSTGEIHFAGDYENDVQTGNWTEYYEDDSYGIGPMQDFIKNGEWRIYNAGGFQIMSGNYINDKRQGIWKVYDAKGQYAYDAEFVDDDQVIK